MTLPRMRSRRATFLVAVAALAAPLCVAIAPAEAAGPGACTATTIEAAFTDATPAGCTFTLAGDTIVGQTLVLGQGDHLTVDLGGHTLTVTGNTGNPGGAGTGGAQGGGGADGDPALIVRTDAALTFLDGAVAATGGVGGAGGAGGAPGGPGGAGGAGGYGVANLGTVTLADATLTASGGAGGAGGPGGSSGGTPGAAGASGPQAYTGSQGEAKTVTVNGNGADTPHSFVAYAATVADALAALTSAFGNWPIRAGYTFAGWYTAASGGTAVVLSTPANDQTIYAQWIAVSSTTPPPPPAACTNPPFPDVPTSNTFCAAIAWLAAQHITAGYTDGNFHPAAAISRQAMAAYLYRLDHHGVDAAACTASPYPDVALTNPFCGAITWLKAQQITTGYTDGGFHPSAPITRQALAAYLYRYAHQGQHASACTTAPFPDVATTDTFCGAIAWLKAQQLTTGYADGGFHPAANITRQAMAAILQRYATG